MRRQRSERGAGAIEMVMGMGLMMMLLVVFVQFVIWQYVRASVRVAALDGARAGSVVDATAADCLAAFSRATSDLLSGPMGNGVGQPRCSKGPEETTVVVNVSLEPTFGLTPRWVFTVTALAETERID